MIKAFAFICANLLTLSVSASIPSVTLEEKSHRVLDFKVETRTLKVKTPCDLDSSAPVEEPVYDCNTNALKRKLAETYGQLVDIRSRNKIGKMLLAGFRFSASYTTLESKTGKRSLETEVEITYLAPKK